MPITPGPWTTAKGERSVNVGSFAKCRFESGLDADELQANCRLIAAAPDLLEALRWALRVHFDILKRESEPWTDAAEKAIAKAVGR